jgi:uncharacterized protein YwgA
MGLTHDSVVRKALLHLILNESGGVDGRVKLQKMVLLTDSLGWHAFEDYRFYHYGPYSDSLMLEIQNLESYGLVSVKKSRYNDRPYYLHRLTTQGKSTLNTLLSFVRNPNLISRTKGLVSELKEYSSEDLAVMASLYLLKTRHPSSNRQQLTKELRELKPHLRENKISRAFVIFEIMKKYS